MDPEANQNVPSLPGLILCLFLFCLAVVASPGFLERLFPLDWRLGNMRPVAYGVQAILAALAALALLFRERINTLYRKWFPTRRQLLFSILAFSFSTVLSLLAAELGFRLLHLPFTEQLEVSENALGQFDPELGWVYLPNHTVVQEFGGAKRKVPMYFDSLGCRVRAPGVHHDPAAPTILFVGDSFTFGHGLPYEETFVGQLESMPGFPFQVVNLGVQGYGTDQSLLLLKRRFKNFNTKIVVYTYLDQHPDRNAIGDLRLFHRFSRFLATKPVFGLRPEGTLYLKQKPVSYQEMSYSRLWACVQIAWLRWGPKPDLALTRALVREMKNYVESNGATFEVVYWNQASRTVAPRGSPFSGMNLDVVNTATNPPPGWSTWTIPGDGHPDARAHAYVARLLSDHLVHNNRKPHRRLLARRHSHV